MARAGKQAGDGNEVRGRVLLDGTDVGIPDLVVVVEDVDAVAAGTAPAPDADSRLGSSVTDAAGAFLIQYRDDAFAPESDRRPDLRLSVMAPERSGAASADPLFQAVTVRRNAGRQEEYVVRIPADILEREGIAVDGLSSAPAALATRFSVLNTRRREIATIVRDVHGSAVDDVRQRADAFDSTLRPQLESRLSRLSPGQRAHVGFVSPGESVDTKTRAVISTGLVERFGSAGRPGPELRGLIALTDAQKTAVDAVRTEDGSVSGEDFRRILAMASGIDDNSTSVVRRDPLLEICGPRSEERTCGERTLGLSVPESSDDGEAPADEVPEAPVPPPATEQDIAVYLGRLLHAIESPEDALTTRPSPAPPEDLSRQTTSLHERIRALNISGGPADVASLHEFHELRIAFEHVWQEAIDEGVLDLGEEAYDQIVDLGGRTDLPDLDALRREARLITRSRRNQTRTGGLAEVASTIGRDHRDPSGIDGWLALLGYEVKRTSERVPARRGTSRKNERVPATRGSDATDDKGGGTHGIVVDHRDDDAGLPALLEELERRLRDAYPFTVYAANSKERSINFGIVVTYRQKWQPRGYQAGDLVRTLTLAPGESRKYSVKEVVRRRRAEREASSSLHSRRTEENETMRAESAIIRRAMTRTNFSLSTEGSFEIEIAEGKQTTSVTREASRSSDETKKQFHESVFRAAEEFKQERKVEVSTEEAVELERQEVTEIKNSNDELPVTFMFFEFQRRFHVSERIHRITPVILVAQEVPAPNEIDEAWLIAHDWTLRRVILDDSFLPGLTYVATKLVGDEVVLEQLLANVEQQRTVADELKEELVVIRGDVKQRYKAFEAAVQREIAAGGTPGSIGEMVGDLVGEGLGAIPVVGSLAGAFGFGGGDDAEAARIRREAADAAYEQALREEKSLLGRLEREVSALQQATEAYNSALRELTDGRLQVARLKTHIKQNILHYMQAIWSHEPHDQRFFRLHAVPVPTLRAKQQHVFVGETADKVALSWAPHRHAPSSGGSALLPYRFTTRIEFGEELEYTTLARVADLDRPLGFKGNYMILPLVTGNDLTDFMMAPYVDRGFGDLHDPDEPGNWSLEEFAQYVCCLEKHLTEDQFEAIKPDLRAQYEALLTTSRRTREELVIPTGSVVVDSLQGAHSVLEPFKRFHRAMDALSAQAAARKAELDNLRRAARLLGKDYSDPDVDKKVVIEGPGDVVVPPADA